jgi:MFS family permease
VCPPSQQSALKSTSAHGNDASRSGATLKIHTEDSPAEAADSPSSIAIAESSRPALNPKNDRRYVTAALMLVMVLASMEMMIASTAMPTIIGDLHGLEHYSWVTSVFLLMSTVSMPLYGRLADAWGRKRVVLWAIAIFCAASVLAASAQSLTQLIFFRGLQGLGAGGIMPVVLTILGDIFTLEERARIQGFFSTVWGTSALAGPWIGAILVESLGWRSIFYVNLPLGALGFGVLAWKYHDHDKPHSTNLDLPGVGLLALACAAALTLVSSIGTEWLTWPIGVVLFVVTCIAFFWFVRVERVAENPILPPSLIANPAIGPPLIASALMGIAFFSIDTYVPLYVQGTTGAGPKAAAGVITPIMLAWAASGVFAAPIILRWGFRKTAITGSCLSAFGLCALFVCALLAASGWVLGTVLFITGVGFGGASMPFLLSAQHGVGWQQRGIVTSANQFFRTMGGAIGIGLLGMLFNVLAAPEMQRLRDLGFKPAAIMDPRTAGKFPEDVQQVIRSMIEHGLTWVFLAMAIVACCQIYFALRMPRDNDRMTADDDSTSFEAIHA